METIKSKDMMLYLLSYHSQYWYQEGGDKYVHSYYISGFCHCEHCSALHW